MIVGLMPFIVSGIVSFLATPIVIKFAKKFNLIDDPSKKNEAKVIHTKPTPRGGGLAIFTGFLAASLIFLPIDKHLIGIIAGAGVLVIMGLLDDKFNLNPYLRLTIQFVAALMPIAAGIGISFATNPLTSQIVDLTHPRISFNLLGQVREIWILADLFALFWIVSIMNFLNMGAKGVDGQLTGVVAIAAAAIGAISLKFGADITQWPVIILASITAGSFLGFLPWHIYPQKIMPSFSGSNLGGYLLAILSILATAKVGALSVVLAVPLIDTGYTIIRRVLSGKSPVWGDDKHLHHRLLKLGFSKMQIAVFYWLVTLILGFLAINLNATNKLYTIVGVGIFLGGFLLWATYRPQIKKNDQ